jgi:hypothetical protein
MTREPPSRGHSVRLLFEASVVLTFAPSRYCQLNVPHRRQLDKRKDLSALTWKQVLRRRGKERVASPVRILEFEVAGYQLHGEQEG